jgi:hypothetical protein
VRCVTIISLLLISWNAHAQDLIGLVQDDSTKQPLHGAHVWNLSKKQLVTTGRYGIFSLPVSTGDSIIITFVGFEDYSLVVRQEHLDKYLLFSLQEQKVTLNDVVVTPFVDYAEKPVIELDSLVAIRLKLPKVDYTYDYDPREEPIPDTHGSTFGTSISFNLEKFTKLHKEKVQYAESYRQDQKWKIAEQRFNREWLTEMTHLEGDELTNFIAYCNFSVDYLAQASQLDLQDHVLAKLEKYKLEKE